MPWRIEVALKDGIRDARGERVRREIREHLGIELTAVRTIDVYTVDAALSEAEVAAAASGPFCDPVIQEVAINRPLADDFDLLIEVGFRPGVTDNTGRTAREAIQYLTRRPFAPGRGSIPRCNTCSPAPSMLQTAEQHCRRSAGQRTDPALDDRCRRTISTAARVCRPSVPKVDVGGQRTAVQEIDLNVSDAELLAISKAGMLALTLEEMKIIQAFAADPQAQCGAAEGRPRRQAHRLRTGSAGADLERALQAQDLLRPHRLRGHRHRRKAADRLPVQELHRPRHPRDPPAAGQGRYLSVGLQGQRRGHPLQRRLEPRLQGGNPQLARAPSIPTAAP